MQDFIYKLFQRVKYYFNGTGKPPPSSIQQLENNLSKLTPNRIEAYEILTQGRRVVSLKTGDVITLIEEFKHAIEVIRLGETVDIVPREYHSLLLDDWFCDPAGRYLDVSTALITLKESTTDFLDAYKKIKQTNESKAEYYRVKYGVLADDANVVIETILE